LKSWLKISTFIDDDDEDGGLEESVEGALEGITLVEVLD
jgi:hypothetical protein